MGDGPTVNYNQGTDAKPGASTSLSDDPGHLHKHIVPADSHVSRFLCLDYVYTIHYQIARRNHKLENIGNIRLIHMETIDKLRELACIMSGLHAHEVQQLKSKPHVVLPVGDKVT